MKWIARSFAFIAALILGAYVASFFAPSVSKMPDSCFRAAPFDLNYGSPRSNDLRPVESRGPITAESLLGTWTGSWGHDDGSCTIVINKVEGNAFSGTLRKSGSAVKLQGTFDPKTRKFTLNETKVINLGTDTTEWSLGKNSGIMSQDGRIMVGDGQDKWGQYGWAVSNY